MKTLLIILIAFCTNSSLTITSKSFLSNGPIPSNYTCDGENLSPALHIENLPKATKTIAIIVHDPDAPVEGGFTHWIAWNIGPTKDIPENFKGGKQGLNGANKAGYTGPCPPSGIHHYHFNVYALDTILMLDANTNKEDLEKAMEGHILAQGDLVGFYEMKKVVSGK